MPAPPTPGSLEIAAARYVERYGGTTARLRRALKRRIAEHPELEPVIEAIVGRYAASGMVDDAAWAASRARRLIRRGVAPAVVRGRLREEGLDGAAALAEVDGDPTLTAACAYVRRRRLGPFRAERDDETDLARMGRAGFPYATAKRALGMSREQIEQALR